jgi:thiol-disulfide isomerase/thioredoxin
MKRWLALLVYFGLMIGLQAQSTRFEIGAPPLPITVKEWIKGGPVTVEPGKIYVVEFWTTWCQRCREIIPQVMELQKKFKEREVVFMALTDEAPSIVNLFVKKMGERIDFPVGIDERDRLYQAYMNGFGVSGLPYVFVIDKDGLLVWYGDSMGILEKVLEQLVAGKFDLQAAIKRDQFRKLQQGYLTMINAPEERATANQQAEEFLSVAAKEPAVLNEFAWSILTNPKVKYRDVALALRTAKLAFEASGGKNGPVLDTYARALSENGRNNDAIQIQKTAIGLARDEEQRIEFEANLRKYLRLAREKAR